MADNAPSATTATINTKELNISFENLSYNAKVGLFKRRKSEQS
jgi:hypothetical protein